MTLAILIVVAAVLTLALTLGLAVSRTLRPASRTNLEAQIELIDIVAFRNLVDPAEDEYLRRHLSPADFRVTQRSRLRARVAYIRVAGRNAAVLILMGQAALASNSNSNGNNNDAQVREAALRLVDDALLLRRNAAFALLRSYAAMAWPNYGSVNAGIIDRYERFSNSAMLLGRLRNPAVPLRVAAGPQ
jgi:hypothetical protein